MNAQRLFYGMVLIFVAQIGFAQSNTSKSANNYQPPTNLERYQVDYEVKNMSLPDPAQIAQLDLDAIESSRQLDQRVEVVDAPTGLTLIVYSAKEAGQKKAPHRNKDIATPKKQD